MKALFLWIFLTLLSSCGAAAEDRQSIILEDLEAGFTLEKPHSFEVVPHTELQEISANARLLMRQAGGFPTFNVILQPGSYDLNSQSLEQRGQELVQSYRDLGLLETRLLQVQETAVSGVRSLSADVMYRSRATQLRSHIVIVPAFRRHFIITWIDDDSTYSGNLPVLQALLTSFRLQDGVTKMQEQASASGNYWVVAVVLVVTVCGLARLRYRQACSAKEALKMVFQSFPKLKR